MTPNKVDSTRTFRFRVVRPRPTQWVEQDGVSVKDAIQEWHLSNTRVSASYFATTDSGGKEKRHYALFELEDGSELLSLICENGIFRSGEAYKRRTPETVAGELGVSVDELDSTRFEEV